MVLAHGGTGGAAIEMAVLLVPVVILVLVAWKARITERSDAPEEGLTDQPKE